MVLLASPTCKCLARYIIKDYDSRWVPFVRPLPKLQSLCIKTNEPSPFQRRGTPSLQYITKLKSNPTNRAYYVLLYSNYKDPYARIPYIYAN